MGLVVVDVEEERCVVPRHVVQCTLENRVHEERSSELVLVGSESRRVFSNIQEVTEEFTVSDRLPERRGDDEFEVVEPSVEVRSRSEVRVPRDAHGSVSGTREQFRRGSQFVG